MTIWQYAATQCEEITDEAIKPEVIPNVYALALRVISDDDNNRLCHIYKFWVPYLSSCDLFR